MTAIIALLALTATPKQQIIVAGDKALAIHSQIKTAPVARKPELIRRLNFAVDLRLNVPKKAKQQYENVRLAAHRVRQASDANRTARLELWLRECRALVKLL